MNEYNLLVRRIQHGTVIDHINIEKGLQVLNTLEIDGKDGNVITIALNVPSNKIYKKDIIKIENRFLIDDETNKIAIIAPKSTINIIKNFKVVEKRNLALPDQINKMIICNNPECITNSNEDIDTMMDVIDKKILRCRYCNRVFDINKLTYNRINNVKNNV